MGCGASKVLEHKNKKWIDELTDADGFFLPFEDWRRIIEKVKDEDEGKDEEEKDSKVKLAVKRKGCAKIANKVHGTSMKMLHDTVAKVLSKAEGELRIRGEVALADIINGLLAVALTYLYEHKDEDKFSHLRTFAVGKLAISLAVPFQAAGAKMGGHAAAATESLEQAAGAVAGAGQTVEEVLGKLTAVIDESKAMATAMVSGIVDTAAAKGDKGAAASEIASLLFAELSGRLSVKVDDMLAASYQALATMLRKGEELAALAAKLTTQVERAQSPEYGKLQQALQSELEALHSKLSSETHKLVSAAVYGAAQLTPPEAPAPESDDEGGGDKKSRLPKKLLEARAKRKAKIEGRWQHEVWVQANGVFKGYDGWEALYGEQKKEKKEKEKEKGKEDDSKKEVAREDPVVEEQGAAARGGGEPPTEDDGKTPEQLAQEEEELQQEEAAAEEKRKQDNAKKLQQFLTVMEKNDLAGKVSDSCVGTLDRVASIACGQADAAARPKQPPALGWVVNCVACLCYSYYFEQQAKRRCLALRGEALSRLATALVEALRTIEQAAGVPAPDLASEQQVERASGMVAAAVVGMVKESAKAAVRNAVPGMALAAAGDTDAASKVKGKGDVVAAAVEKALSEGIHQGVAQLEPYLTKMLKVPQS